MGRVGLHGRATFFPRETAQWLWHRPPEKQPFAQMVTLSWCRTGGGLGRPCLSECCGNSDHRPTGSVLGLFLIVACIYICTNKKNGARGGETERRVSDRQQARLNKQPTKIPSSSIAEENNYYKPIHTKHPTGTHTHNACRHVIFAPMFVWRYARLHAHKHTLANRSTHTHTCPPTHNPSEVLRGVGWGGPPISSRVLNRNLLGSPLDLWGKLSDVWRKYVCEGHFLGQMRQACLHWCSYVCTGGRDPRKSGHLRHSPKKNFR